jgi:hypothetical protein
MIDFKIFRILGTLSKTVSGSVVIIGMFFCLERLLYSLSLFKIKVDLFGAGQVVSEDVLRLEDGDALLETCVHVTLVGDFELAFQVPLVVEHAVE